MLWIRSLTTRLCLRASRKQSPLGVGGCLYSRNEAEPQGIIEAKVVEEVFQRFAAVLSLHVGGQVIRTTHEHPFFAYDKGWIAARDLVPGDRMLTEAGQWQHVEELFDTGEWETVYNLRIADYHTYFVGDTHWGWSAWVHNLSCDEFSEVNI